MRKFLLILLLSGALLLSAGCGTVVTAADPAETPPADAEAEQAHQPEDSRDGAQAAEKAPRVMSRQAFLDAGEDSPVAVEGYVQAKETWRDGCCSLYLQNEEGAFYLSRMRCSQEEYESLAIGRKVRVNGYKSHWNDSLEISDASFRLLEGSMIAEPADVTALLGSDQLILHQNEKVRFHGMTVEAMPDGVSVWYSGWDNSTPAGEDAELWFRASSEGTLCDFTVKPSLCQNREELLQTLQQLRAGDRVDLTGYLRYYNGPLPCITEIIPADGNLTEPS